VRVNTIELTRLSDNLDDMIEKEKVEEKREENALTIRLEEKEEEEGKKKEEKIEEENALEDLEDPSLSPSPLEYPEEEEISFEGEEENILEDLEDPSPSPPLEYSEEEIFEIINQLNFIYLLNTLTIGQEDKEEEEE